jgi:hypothetical protein
VVRQGLAQLAVDAALVGVEDRPQLELVVELGGMLFEHGLEAGAQGVCPKWQAGRHFRAFEAHLRTRVAHDGEHGFVLARHVDDQRADAAVAGVHDRVIEQPRAKAATAHAARYRNAEFSQQSVWGEGQVRHGDQAQAAVKDTEYLVVHEVDLIGVARDLFIGGNVGEPQLPILRRKCLQVSADLIAVA